MNDGTPLHSAKHLDKHRELPDYKRTRFGWVDEVRYRIRIFFHRPAFSRDNLEVVKHAFLDHHPMWDGSGYSCECGAEFKQI